MLRALYVENLELPPRGGGALTALNLVGRVVQDNPSELLALAALRSLQGEVQAAANPLAFRPADLAARRGAVVLATESGREREIYDQGIGCVGDRVPLKPSLEARQHRDDVIAEVGDDAQVIVAVDIRKGGEVHRHPPGVGANHRDGGIGDRKSGVVGDGTIDDLPPR